MTEFFGVLSKLLDKGATGLVIFVVVIFLWYINKMTKDQKAERSEINEARTAERKIDAEARVAERGRDIDNFRSSLAEFKSELSAQRADFKEELTKQRADFVEQLSQGRHSFADELQKLTLEFHERHENLQGQVVEFIKDGTKVQIATNTAITELRDEIRVTRDSKKGSD